MDERQFVGALAINGEWRRSVVDGLEKWLLRRVVAPALPRNFTNSGGLARLAQSAGGIVAESVPATKYLESLLTEPS
jgi:hypothetical protein